MHGGLKTGLRTPINSFQKEGGRKRFRKHRKCANDDYPPVRGRLKREEVQRKIRYNFSIGGGQLLILSSHKKTRVGGKRSGGKSRRRGAPSCKLVRGGEGKSYGSSGLSWRLNKKGGRSPTSGACKACLRKKTATASGSYERRQMFLFFQK